MERGLGRRGWWWWPASLFLCRLWTRAASLTSHPQAQISPSSPLPQPLAGGLPRAAGTRQAGVTDSTHGRLRSVCLFPLEAAVWRWSTTQQYERPTKRDHTCQPQMGAHRQAKRRSTLPAASRTGKEAALQPPRRPAGGSVHTIPLQVAWPGRPTSSAAPSCGTCSPGIPRQRSAVNRVLAQFHPSVHRVNMKCILSLLPGTVPSMWMPGCGQKKRGSEAHTSIAIAVIEGAPRQSTRGLSHHEYECRSPPQCWTLLAKK